MQEIITKTKGYIKNNYVVLIVGLALIILSCVISYSSGKNAQIDAYILQERANADQRLGDVKKQLDDAKTELSSQQDVISELNEYKANKEAKNAEIEQLNASIQEKSNNITTLDNDIAAKSEELEKLKNAIVKTGEAPKVLGAGHYTVGSDIPAGRYVVTGDSNFVVYSASGRLKVNTILGGGRWGEESYTCQLDKGDTMELSSKDTFTPIK